MLNLLVIRSPAPESAVRFYEKLGLSFEYHRHGGPLHYSAVMNGVVFEIYPLLKGQHTPDTSLRLGFKVGDLDKLINELDAENIILDQQPDHMEWGYTAVVIDPDGRKIELTQKDEI
ncbi:MAG: glyoxalase/bleomycin resistance/extradiol dioxygenase family protein [Lewinella sp.]|nr:glyoxalase/bleomycin resistance/extradiol dioxygenase family protein [Lewinella sp.]